jgi:inosine-uridine nucleoside N-ribohydrolase
MHKVLLDTDIGSDIDDAVCLAYLLAHPDCELLGVTTVSGQPIQRAKMASAQCVAAGKTIPIFPGAEAPLMVEARQPAVPQAEMLTRWPHATAYANGQAISFLRDSIRANPGEVTLLAIGPLTNIALLFRSDPEIPYLLKEFVIMGGDFRMPPPPNWRQHLWEWNIYCDPHAAAIVFNSPAQIRAIGIEVTTQVTLQADDVRTQFAKHTLLHPVLDFADVWFRDGHKRITFHDPLAACAVFEPDICGYDRGVSQVELASGADHARTYWQADPVGRHLNATTVDAKRFFERFFATFEP